MEVKVFNKNSKDSSETAKKKASPDAEQNSNEVKKAANPTRTVSYIGPGLSFSGEVEVDEGLVVEGKVEGSIAGTDKNLVIGKKGQVKGDIRASVIEVRGTVDGEIYGSVRVHLYSTAVIDGTIYCKNLVMEEGAVLNGAVDMKWKEQAKQPARLKSVETKSAGAEAAEPKAAS
jgi:cytoskeletal protein CcmA (bactofilin family)